MDLILYAIPVFLLSILLEVVWDFLFQKKYYRLNDSLADLGCGIVEQITHIFTRVFILYNYHAVYEYLAVTSIEVNWLSWIVLFFAVDFCYYLFHRTAHRVNIVWATHIVHHSSEEYNLAVALRQGAFSNIFSTFFYVPLAICGFDPLQFVTCHSINLIYQFFIHTRNVDKFPAWIEAVMNTPSHHRVHHGRNPEYIDKNYAGVFIIWDRLLGTFEKERASVLYGVTTPIRSFDPVWANFHYPLELIQRAWMTQNWKSKVDVFLRGPEFIPSDCLSDKDLGLSAPPVWSVYNPRVSDWMKTYCLLQFLALLPVTLSFLIFHGSMSWSLQFLVGSFIVFSCASLGRMMAGTRYWFFLESVRMLLLFQTLIFLQKAGFLPF